MESLDKKIPEPNEQESNDVNQMGKLLSLMGELREDQLCMKREFEELRTTLNSMKEWFMEMFGTIKQYDLYKNGTMKDKKDEQVEVINISSGSSSPLTTRGKKKMTHSAASKKGKTPLRSPVRLRSPICTRQNGSKKYSIGPFTSSQPASTRELLLIIHVFDQSKDQSEEFVRSPWFDLRRAEFKVLVPELCLSTKIIIMCVDLLTLNEFRQKTRIHWFLSPAFSMSARGDPVLGYSEENLKKVYCSEDFNDCEKIFVPVLLDGHFFLSVFDLKKEVNQVWDSFPNFLDLHRREEKLREIANALDLLFFDIIVKRFDMKMLGCFTIELVSNAPRQKNGFDCGLFVLKLMRGGGCLDECARRMKKKFDSHEERLELALYLLNHQENMARDILHQKVVMESGARVDRVESTVEKSGTSKDVGKYTTYPL